jgi:hypothetical protein
LLSFVTEGAKSPLFVYCSFNEARVSPALSIMRIDYTAPWNVRYWAEDYAQEAMETVISAGYWPAGSLTVEHTDPTSPTHWRVKMVNGPGFSQPGW